MSNKLFCFGKKLQQIFSCSFLKLTCLTKSIGFLFLYYYRFFVLMAKPFWIELVYFVTLSFLGFWVLKLLNPRTPEDSFRPRNLDYFFTSVSATTVSSMSTVEMEVFSNAQLIIMTILMFIGGEVFTSMVGLHLRKFNLKMMMTKDKVASVNSDVSSSSRRPTDVIDHIELGLATEPDFQDLNPIDHDPLDGESLKLYSTKFLGYVVLGYLLVIHILGVAMVSLYLTLISSARNVLKNKGLNMHTFTVFTTVSTFSSCGFVPTNENMMVFSKNSGLLLMLIPQVLLGNTLLPPSLRFSIWVLGKCFKKREHVCNYLLKNTREVGFLHLLPSLHSSLLVVTVFGFILLQFVPFCVMEWSSESLSGLNSYQKIVGALFQSANSRHTGETIVDLSIISPAILVLFVVMMYLPPYTSFLPMKDDDERNHLQPHQRRKKLVKNLLFSQLSYLVIFIILICITERTKMKDDPLNFSVLNIVVEVISAYGNVGFTTGYSCKRQLNPNGLCEDKWYGFSGRWTDEGKMILIAVMFFGRLKKFNMDGGRGWKLL